MLVLVLALVLLVLVTPFEESWIGANGAKKEGAGEWRGTGRRREREGSSSVREMQWVARSVSVRRWRVDIKIDIGRKFKLKTTKLDVKHGEGIIIR